MLMPFQSLTSEQFGNINLLLILFLNFLHVACRSHTELNIVFSNLIKSMRKRRTLRK